MFKKSSAVVLGLVMLGGCQHGLITHEVNGLTEVKTCKLKNYLLRNEFGFTSSRQSYLTLAKQVGQDIDALLVSKSNSGLFGYDGFTERSEVKFILKYKNNKAEEMILKTKTLPTTHEGQLKYLANLGFVRDYQQSSPIVFSLTPEQLQKIVDAAHAEYFVESGDHPFKGTLDDHDKGALVQFLGECCR